jgi:hypothetical protein
MTIVKPGREPSAGIAAVAAAVTAVTERELCIDGRTIEVDDGPPPAFDQPFYHADPAVSRLGSELYDRYYCRGLLPGEAAEPGGIDHEVGDLLIDRLSRAATAGSHQSRGWKIEADMARGTVIGRRGWETRSFLPGTYLRDEPLRAPEVGEALEVSVRRSSSKLQPAFFHVFGAKLGDSESERHVVRFYWHLTPDGALPLIEWARRRLDGLHLPFQLKCLSTREAYRRADAAVLYVGERYVPLIFALLGEIYPRLAGLLRRPTPLFTLELMPGLAVAESPANGRSFGVDRCLVIAEGVREAFRDGGATTDDLAAAVTARFAAHGLCPERPYLRSVDHDVLQLAARATQGGGLVGPA